MNHFFFLVGSKKKSGDNIYKNVICAWFNQTIEKERKHIHTQEKKTPNERMHTKTVFGYIFSSSHKFVAEKKQTNRKHQVPTWQNASDSIIII